MTMIINTEAPKTTLVTMGKASKEIEMAKEPVADYYPPGTTEPIVRPDNIPAPEPAKAPEVEGVDVIKNEPADKAGPVGAKGEPKKVAKKK